MIEELVKRYMDAVEALHTVHSNTDVHNLGGVAGQAITEHCALICRATGGYLDSVTMTVVEGQPPHKAVLEEYEAAKRALSEALSV